MVCSVKQKQLIFSKYLPTVSGATLYAACPVVVRAAWLVTLKNTVTTSPILISISFCSGSNFQGNPGATLESKRTAILRVSGAEDGAEVATWVVPLKPVARQNQL